MNNNDEDSWIDLLIDLFIEILKAGLFIAVFVFLLAIMYFKMIYL